MPDGVEPKTKAHIEKLFTAFGHDIVESGAKSLFYETVIPKVLFV